MAPDKKHNWNYKMDNFRTACHKACCLWLAGFREACCLHRAYFFCKRSRKIFIKTGQCFLLNGCIFLGSIFFLRRVIVPTLQWLLMSNSKEEQQAIRLGETFTGTLQKIFVGICYVFWLYPLKLISFIINFIWYNEIAEQAYEVLERNQNMERLQKQQQPTQRQRAGQGSGELESILLNIGEQIWSFSMLIMFLIEVSLVSFVPHIGQILNFFLLAFYYAYYCFDYKWGFAKWSLERRLLFFETNWAFFAGFGSPCVLATFCLPPLVSDGVRDILLPIFVLVATVSHPGAVVASYTRGKDSSHAPTMKVPVFYLANMLMLLLVRTFRRLTRFISSRS